MHGGKLFLKKENREKYNSWVIFPQCSENDRWPSLKSDTWNKVFNNKITKPNKSLGLVIKLMDEFIKFMWVVYLWVAWELLKYYIEDQICLLLQPLFVVMEVKS